MNILVSWGWGGAGPSPSLLPPMVVGWVEGRGGGGGGAPVLDPFLQTPFLC